MGHMARLEDIDVESIRSELQTYDQRRPVMRLLTAIIYKQGPSVPTLAEWLNVRPATIYAWFDKLESEPIGEAVLDRQRPGRPPKLTEEERSEFLKALDQSPDDVGLEEDEWKPSLVQEFLEMEFDVSYTERHVRRMMDRVAND